MLFIRVKAGCIPCYLGWLPVTKGSFLVCKKVQTVTDTCESSIHMRAAFTLISWNGKQFKAVFGTVSLYSVCIYCMLEEIVNSCSWGPGRESDLCSQSTCSILKFVSFSGEHALLAIRLSGQMSECSSDSPWPGNEIWFERGLLSG